MLQNTSKFLDSAAACLSTSSTHATVLTLPSKGFSLKLLGDGTQAGVLAGSPTVVALVAQALVAAADSLTDADLLVEVCLVCACNANHAAGIVPYCLCILRAQYRLRSTKDHCLSSTRHLKRLSLMRCIDKFVWVP